VLEGEVVEAMPGFAEEPPASLQVAETDWTLCMAMLSLFMLELLPVVALPSALVLLEEVLAAGVTVPVIVTVWLTWSLS
jgi:hypothetical protein